MRSVILLYSGLISTVLLVTIICSITMQSSYSESIRQNLDDSVELSVMLLQNDRNILEREGNYAEFKRANWEDFVWEDGESWEEASSQLIGSDKDYRTDTSLAKSEANDEFKQRFLSYLVANLDSRVEDLEINIYGADALTGLLSVEVIAQFEYPGGKLGTVSTYKTVILNKTLRASEESTP